MRDQNLVLRASPCDVNLYADGPQTLAAARRSICPHFATCNRSGYLGPHGHQCIMQTGSHVAQFMIRDGTTLEAELRELRQAEASRPPKGWVFSPDREHFEIITDCEAALRKVTAFAQTVLGTAVAKDEQRRTVRQTAVGDRFQDIIAHVTTPDGVLDSTRIEALEGRFGVNAGHGCDVRSGACSCGAWH